MECDALKEISMFKIRWDKEKLKHELLNGYQSYSIMDHWIPVFVYVGEIEISGLKDIPGGDVTHILTFFSDTLSVIQLFDPEKLGQTDFVVGRKVRGNVVTGGGFEYSAVYDKITDCVTIQYKNKGITNWRTITMSLREYAEGVLAAAREIISDIRRIAPEKSADDDFLIGLEMDYNTIRSWYEERYHAPVEEKYVIPARFYPV
ncbi:MAG: hypothetical protein GYA23_10120 [Methanomicrobiales archaeon]|nr:hypothetical protein [Methanomicrobiales archaeon]